MPLPVLVFQVVGFLLNLIIACCIIFYFISFRLRAKELEEKEKKVDTNYHHIVDEALAKERKIIDDATTEASHIITQAQNVNVNSKQTIDQAIAKLINDAQTNTTTATQEFKNSYASSLQQMAHESLAGFQKITQELQQDLQKQIQEFHNTLLPGMQKQLEEYKQSRMKQTEQTITRIVQEVSQDVLNKSISLEEHQKLMNESLEKAKKEGMFD